MRSFSRSTLRDFWTKHTDAEEPLKSWYDDAFKADWQSPHAIKAQYANASILQNGRVVFNIKCNDYRLIVKIHYNTQSVFIRFVGTHREYNSVDANLV